MAIEKPEYQVIRNVGDVEIRDYKEHWLAECKVSDVDDLRMASNYAFNRLFNYISGENKSRQKIAMTSPVQQEKDADGWRVSFVVPSSFKPDEIPLPLNASITIRKVPGGKFAALRYRGAWNNVVFTENSERLLAALKADGLEPDGPVVSAVYNPPFTPPILRRNEIIVRLKRG